MFLYGFVCDIGARLCGWMCLIQCKFCGFREVSLFHVFSELVDIQLTSGCLFSRFWGALDLLFLAFEGLGNRFENR